MSYPISRGRRAAAWSILFALGAWVLAHLAASAAEGGAATAAAQAGPVYLSANLLDNPDFEDGFRQREDGAVTVAEGWEPWYVQDPAREHTRRPEWSREWLWLPSIRVLHGDFAQKVFNSWAVHDAGVYQQARDVPVGARLELSAWVQVWSSECDNICRSPTDKAEACRGLTNGDYAVAVGIDPLGGAPTGRNSPPPSSVVWSSLTTRAYDRWVQVKVEAVAQSSTVTVFTRSRPSIAVKHNDSYWDTVSLRVLAPNSPLSLLPLPTPRPVNAVPLASPTPRPGSTSAPTATATPGVATEPGPEKGCWPALNNGGFETNGGWRFSNRMAGFSTARAASGKNALRLGDVAEKRSLRADAWQDVYIPTDVSSAKLRFLVWRAASAASGAQRVKTGEAAGYQSAVVETLDGIPVVYALRPGRVNDTRWQAVEIDLTPFRGRTLRVRFHVTVGAYEAVTLDVDEVSLELCRSSGERQRARQARKIAPHPAVQQEAGRGVRLGYLRYALEQPDFFPFPNECSASQFEFIELENFGAAVNLGGWTLSDAGGNRYTFPAMTLPPGYRVRVWTGVGPDHQGERVADLFAGFGGELWGDTRDEIRLNDDTGGIVARYRYEWGD